MPTVQAAVLLGPGKMEIREFPKPELAADAIWLKVEYAGVCGTDKHYYEGHSRLPFEMIAGHEIVGTVAELGPRANESMTVVGGPLKEGDRVTVAPSSRPCGKCWFCLNVPTRPMLCPNRIIYGLGNTEKPPYLLGGFAEYVYLHGTSYVFKLADVMPSELAVLAEPMAPAYRAITRAFPAGLPIHGEGYGPNKSVVVLGAGTVGLLAIVAFKHTGAGRVIAVDVLDSRLELARRMGADELLNAKSTTVAERVAAVRELTEGVGCDILFDAAGVPAAFREGLEMVRRGGTVVEVGHFVDTGGLDLHPHEILQKDLTIHGSLGYPPLTFREALALLQATRAPVRDLVTHVFSLAETEKALQVSGTEGSCKVVIKPQPAITREDNEASQPRTAHPHLRPPRAAGSHRRARRDVGDGDARHHP
ncbi:MAG: zinc-binding dehydrogenase [Chloroflexi bacterium]|nr:zinc-binding dehydrogenase [Chloroflexota bacterium]